MDLSFSSNSSSSFRKKPRFSSEKKETFEAYSITTRAIVPRILDLYRFVIFPCMNLEISKIEQLSDKYLLNINKKKNVNKTIISDKSIVMERIYTNDEIVHKIYTLDSDNKSHELIEALPGYNFNQFYDCESPDCIFYYRSTELHIENGYNHYHFHSMEEAKSELRKKEESKEITKVIKYSIQVDYDIDSYENVIFLFDEEGVQEMKEVHIDLFDFLYEIGKVNIITDEDGNLSFENYTHADDDDEKDDEMLKIPKCL